MTRNRLEAPAPIQLLFENLFILDIFEKKQYLVKIDCSKIE